jgi:hypothetical protein
LCHTCARSPRNIGHMVARTYIHDIVTVGMCYHAFERSAVWLVLQRSLARASTMRGASSSQRVRRATRARRAWAAGSSPSTRPTAACAAMCTPRPTTWQVWANVAPTRGTKRCDGATPSNRSCHPAILYSIIRQCTLMAASFHNAPAARSDVSHTVGSTSRHDPRSGSSSSSLHKNHDQPRHIWAISGSISDYLEIYTFSLYEIL